MFNANNYGYNPYGSYIPQRPVQQPIQQPIQPIQQPMEQVRTGLNGKIVDSLEMARASEYPLDGSISFYPLADQSSIVTKQLQMDGTSKVVIFKPVEDTKPITPKYITKNDLEQLFDELGINTLDDIKNDVESLKTQIKGIINNKPKSKGE